MDPAEAARKAALGAGALAALDGGRRRGALPIAFFVPGRIEVLGKHTDYAGGRSLLCAVQRGFVVAAAPRADRLIRVVDVGWRAETVFPLDSALDVAPTGWANYPMTVARRLARNFPDARTGADIALASDLPSGSGMSSSSALLTAVYLVLAEVNGVARSPVYRRAIRSVEDLAGYLGTIENGQSFDDLAGDRGVGTFGGSEDHAAILGCRAGALSQFRFCPVRLEATVPLPPGWTFVIAASGIVASKTGAARDLYNRASASTARILDLWRRSTGRTDATLAEAAASAPDAPGRIVDMLLASHDPDFPAALLARRFRQFVDESDRIIPEVGRLISEGRVDEIGPMVDASQRGAEEGLGNQVPETVALARAARQLGAAASSAFGAGFGGAVWALVREDWAESFAGRWKAVYSEAFRTAARRSAFFASRPGPPATRLQGNSLAG